MNELIDPATGLPLGQALWQQIALSLFGIATILIGVAGMWLSRTLANTVPAWLSAFMDQKLKDDVHGAAVTIVRRIILEGGDPRENMQMTLDYMMESAKDAFVRWQVNGRTAEEVRTIFGNIAISKIPDVVKELGGAINMNPPPAPDSGEIVPAPLPQGGSSEQEGLGRAMPVNDKYRRP